jgi:hypothetical protein
LKTAELPQVVASRHQWQVGFLVSGALTFTGPHRTNVLEKSGGGSSWSKRKLGLPASRREEPPS